MHRLFLKIKKKIPNAYKSSLEFFNEHQICQLFWKKKKKKVFKHKLLYLYFETECY